MSYFSKIILQQENNLYTLIFLFFRNNVFLAIDVILLTVTAIFAVSAMVVLCAGWAVTCNTLDE